MPKWCQTVTGPYIQLRETSYINVLNKHLCKSYINVDGWNARIEEKYATEAMCLASGRAANPRYRTVELCKPLDKVSSFPDLYPSYQ